MFVCAGGGDVREQPEQHLDVPEPRQVQAPGGGGDGTLQHSTAQCITTR